MRKHARRSGGISASRHAELTDLHREVVMRRYSIEPALTDAGNASWYGKCLRCHNERWLQCAHIMGKGKAPRMKYDPDNALPLCWGCHVPWGHTQPFAFVRFVTEVVGAEYVRELERRELMFKATRQKVDYGAVYVALFAECKRLRAAQGGG